MAGTEELLGRVGRLMEKTHGDRLGKNLVKKKEDSESFQPGGQGGRASCDVMPSFLAFS